MFHLPLVSSSCRKMPFAKPLLTSASLRRRTGPSSLLLVTRTRSFVKSVAFRIRSASRLPAAQMVSEVAVVQLQSRVIPDVTGATAHLQRLCIGIRSLRVNVFVAATTHRPHVPVFEFRMTADNGARRLIPLLRGTVAATFPSVTALPSNRALRRIQPALNRSSQHSPVTYPKPGECLGTASSLRYASAARTETFQGSVLRTTSYLGIPGPNPASSPAEALRYPAYVMPATGASPFTNAIRRCVT